MNQLYAAIVVGLVGVICIMDSRMLGRLSVERPLIGATMVGIVLGDVPTALAAGATLELMSIGPRRILGVDPVSIQAGSVADITVFDPHITWTVGADGYESKARNCGFDGTEVTGRATDVFVGGKQTLRDGVVL